MEHCYHLAEVLLDPMGTAGVLGPLLIRCMPPSASHTISHSASSSFAFNPELERIFISIAMNFWVLLSSSPLAGQRTMARIVMINNTPYLHIEQEIDWYWRRQYPFSTACCSLATYCPVSSKFEDCGKTQWKIKFSLLGKVKYQMYTAICTGRKHRWEATTASGEGEFCASRAMESNIIEGYKLPCCQLKLPTVYYSHPQTHIWQNFHLVFHQFGSTSWTHLHSNTLKVTSMSVKENRHILSTSRTLWVPLKKSQMITWGGI